MAQEWCFPCQQPHNQASCQNAMNAQSQALMVQNNMSYQDVGINEELKGPEVAMMNWQGEEFCGVNHLQEKNRPFSPVEENTRSEKCAIDIGQQATNSQQQAVNNRQQQNKSGQQLDKGKQQASTSHQVVSTPPLVQNVQILPRGHPVAPKEQQKVQSQSKPTQLEPIVPKVQQKVSDVPFNIVESIEKFTIYMTMIDALQILGQKELLRDKLDNLSLTSETQKDQPRVALANDIPVKNNQPIQTPKPPSFL